MKKFMFSAFAGSSFASNEVVCENVKLDQTEGADRPCTIFVSITNGDGSGAVLKKEGGKMSLGKCGELQDSYVRELQEGGVKFDVEKDVLLVWG